MYGSYAAGTGLGEEEVLQITAHQRLVVAHRRQSRRGRELRVQIHRELAVGRGLQPARLHVDRRSRQLDVGQEPLLVVHTLRPVMHQTMVENVCFERIVRRGTTG